MAIFEVPISEVLELADYERLFWDEIQLRIPHWHPQNRVDPPTDPPADPPTDPPADPPEDPPEDPPADTDWKAMARKHEKRARAEHKAREDAERKLKEKEKEDQTEHEKAIAAAREEGEKTALTKAQAERRADRLESATIRLASKGIKVETEVDGEKKTVTLKFADPDDGFIQIERMLRRGDLEEDEIFDENGKVNTDALNEALQELLDSKPHLAASSGNGEGGTKTKVKGGADGGKGSGGGKGIADLSVEEQFERIRQSK